MSSTKTRSRQDQILINNLIHSVNKLERNLIRKNTMLILARRDIKLMHDLIGVGLTESQNNRVLKTIDKLSKIR